MVQLVGKADLLLLERNAAGPAKMRRSGIGISCQHVRLDSIAKVGIESSGFNAGSIVPRDLQLGLNRLRSQPVRCPIIVRQPRSHRLDKFGRADHYLPDIRLKGKVDDKPHRNHMWLEAIALREKPNVRGKMPVADHEVQHAATIFASMSAGERYIKGDDNPTEVLAPAALRNDIRRMVEVADDDPWELGGSNEGDHILNPLLVWSVLGTKVAVKV